MLGSSGGHESAAWFSLPCQTAATAGLAATCAVEGAGVERRRVGVLGVHARVKLARAEAHEHDPWSSASGGALPGGWKGDNPEPGILGVGDGLADWRHRIFALGNGQVPAVAATAWRILTHNSNSA